MFLLSRKKGVRSHVPSQGGNPAKQSDTVQHVYRVTSRHILIKMSIICSRLVLDGIPVGVPLDLSTPTGMSYIGTYGENCKSDNVSKNCVLLVPFLLL